MEIFIQIGDRSICENRFGYNDKMETYTTRVRI